MKDLVIFGAGGLGREVYVLINDINVHKPNTYRILGFAVDKEYYQEGAQVLDKTVIGDLDWICEHKDSVSCVVALGKAKARERVFKYLEEKGVDIETIISPSVYVDPSCRIGRGCIIGYRTVLSVDTQIGDGVFINTDCIFGHDLKINDFTTIWHRVTVSGSCTIGSRVEIGGGTYIIPGKKVGDDAVVAAGSVVFTNVRQNTHVMGNPAKKIQL